MKFELIDYRHARRARSTASSRSACSSMSAPAHYDEFFAKCRELLKPDGVMLLHTIGKLGAVSGAPDPFTDKYIFPGYHLPSLSADDDGEREGAADRQRRRECCGCIMPTRCATGSSARPRRAAKIEAMYDERFFRMWEFYLAGGIVMFESGAACNYQVQYIRDRTRAADHARLHGRGRAALSRAGGRAGGAEEGAQPRRERRRSSLRALELGDAAPAPDRSSPALPRSHRSTRPRSG